MKSITSALTTLSILSTLSTTFAAQVRVSDPPASTLIMDRAPDTVQPYILPHLSGFPILLAGQVYRVLVSAKSSAGAFSLLSGNSGYTAPAPTHNHPHLIETFYVSKGTANLFMNQQSRVASPGDFQMLPPGNNHSLANTDNDFQVLTSYQPAGIEAFLLAAGQEYRSSTNSPFDPEHPGGFNISAAVGLAAKYDVRLALDYPLNLALQNGTSADGAETWHRAPQTLPPAQAPYFLSSNMMPRTLNPGSNAVTSMLAGAAQTRNQTTIATIAIPRARAGTDPLKDGARSHAVSQVVHVLEGTLTVRMRDETVDLGFGDTAFVPAGEPFAYTSHVAWTKFYVYANGTEGIIADALEGGKPWTASVWPAN